jgi:hypothetical protein
VVEAVREAGIPFQIVESRPETDERRSALSVFVRDEDAAAAMRALAPLLGPEAVAYTEPGDDPDDDGPSRCPACDARLPEGTAECPECGLGLRGGPEPGEDG